MSGCDLLVVHPTLERGGTLDLLMTDVPDLVRVAVVALMSNSDHTYLPAVFLMALDAPNLCVSRTICIVTQDLPWCNIWSADNTVEVLDEHNTNL